MHIELALSEPQAVKIEVFSLERKSISVITDKTFDKGTHHWQWNLNQIPNGMYIIEIQKGKTKESHKVIVGK